MLIGGVFFGAVADFGALYASVKNKGKSMGMLIEKYIGKTGRKLFLNFLVEFSAASLLRHSQIWLRAHSTPTLSLTQALPSWLLPQPPTVRQA